MARLGNDTLSLLFAGMAWHFVLRLLAKPRRGKAVLLGVALSLGLLTKSFFLPISAGNVRTADPVALYRDAELFRTLRRTDLFGGRCGRCEYRDPCGGSRSRAWAATGDALAEDPLCAYEPAAPR